MSSYKGKARDPADGKIKDAWWIDDYFGRHQYGVKFVEDGRAYRPKEVWVKDAK